MALRKLSWLFFATALMISSSGCPLSRGMSGWTNTTDFLPTFSAVPPQSEPDPDSIYGEYEENSSPRTADNRDD